ncbi:MAG: site-specific DNA-methyltransferase [Clostridia bacterium]|nr:site-specific DNA-methyltransferase [Clostridia bacterium]
MYIDPPYNTGNEGWVYNDNANDPQMTRWLGEVVGKEDDDFTRHDKWLCMMYPRLSLLRQLLSPEGALFVSADDNEAASLRIVLNEIFGTNCFVADIAWQRTYSIRNDSQGIPVEVEHILLFSKKPKWQPNGLERTEKMDAAYKNPDGDRCAWMSGSPVAPAARTHQGMVYAIQHPFTGEIFYPTNDAHWRYSQEQMLEYMNGWCRYKLEDLHDDERRAEVCGITAEEVRKEVKGIVLDEPLEVARKKAQIIYDKGPWPRFFFTRGGKGGMRRKVYADDVGDRIVTNFWEFKEVGHTDEAKKEVTSIFGGKSKIETPKPTRLLERILKIATKKDSIVLDSCAGSGTTGHATLLANSRDGGRRNFILVELMDYAETTTAERMRRVMRGYSFKGNVKEELYKKKITLPRLRKAHEMLAEADMIVKENRGKYDTLQMTVDDGELKVIGSHTKEIDGLGGEFDYYELGQPIFTEEGELNPAADEEKLRQYIYYSETRKPLTRKRDKDFPYLLDYLEGTGYYFFYERDSLTALTQDTLSIVGPQKSNRYVIYADICNLSSEHLAKMGIEFKKIPRDINRF